MKGLPLIEGRLKQALKEIVKQHAPWEVGGIIVDGTEVIPLTNRSASPTDSFEFMRSELVEAATRALGNKLMGMKDINERVALWHSHPGGGVGPSRTDMVNKTPLKYHLVVTLVDGDIVPTWY